MNEQNIKQRISTLAKLKEKVQADIVKDTLYLNRLEKNQVIESKSNSIKKKVDKKRKSLDDLTMSERRELKKAHLALRKKVCDEQFFERIKPLLDLIPESNGSRYYNKMNTRIGIIADEFLYNSFKGVADFKYIERNNYKKYKNNLEALLVVTTWRGLYEEWRGLGNPKIKKHRNDLYKIIKYYRNQGTKIVFYSKEDPVNYEIFIDIAKQCDYIFTTAIEKIDNYKRDCNNENVYLLEFGINPHYHNPIGIKKFDKRQEVLFTGSWYEKYPHRQVDTRMIFDGVLVGNKKLKIIDRNYNFELIQYFFPDEYLKYVSPSIEHTYLQKLHKLFDWAINLNSIKDSSTMFANRIYELQALGNALLSNYSIGVNNKFPGVFLIQNEQEVKNIFNAFSEEELFKHQVNGIRQVMSSETTFHRIEHLLKTIDIKYEALLNRKVAVLVNEKTDKIVEMFNNQTYEYKTLYTETEFTETQKNNYDIIAYFSENYDYNIFYLEDMINAFKYTDSDYITKDAYYDGGIYYAGLEFDYVNKMKDKYKTVFWSESFTFQFLQNIEGPVELENGFSIDRFNLNDVKVNDEVKQEYNLSVIIPTFNNGNHLLNKCFNSLRRSSIFDDMEIIIVDDGSTDGFTHKIVKYLTKLYSNVKSYCFNDDGSGSASRPRNKGFKLSGAPYVTYLDPDNEAINDGFAKLYNEMSKGTYDLIVGNMIKLDTKKSYFDYYRTAMAYNGSNVLTTGIKEYLVNTQFKAMSIQALIVKREVIAESNLQMVEGAVGQDTVYFHELLMKSSQVKVINEPIHIYYAAVEGTVTNTISKDFFASYLELEKYRVRMLKENNVFNEYVEQRFAYYFQNWYLEKLKLVQPGDEREAVELLCEILDLYGDIQGIYDKRNDVNTEELDWFLLMNFQGNTEEILKRYVY